MQQFLGGPQDIDGDRIIKVGQSLHALTEELKGIFPERDFLIDQIAYALMTREHVLVHGVYGTGKSDLVNTLFGAITGAKTFSIALTKFMTEGHLVGTPDVKVLREEGRIHHCIDGSLLDAHFAELDELFDANSPLLRVLLGILNERNFKRGRQFENALLQTAVGSTNGQPEDEIKKAPELGAVIDRFLFHSKVAYLNEEASRIQMYDKYLRGAKPQSFIDVGDLMYVSNVVVSANQITDPRFVQLHEEIMQAYRNVIKSQNVFISDRRACKVLKLVEASALLHGRYDVVPEDFEAMRFALCAGGNQAQQDVFKAAVHPLIEKAMAELSQNVDDLEVRLLAEYGGRIPSIPAQCSDGDLVALRREIVAVRNNIKDVKPRLNSTLATQAALLKKADARLEEVTQRMDAST